ncbi:unnamed protein product [Camellia sinensis]
MAVQKTNGLLVDDKVLAVKYAAYDRSVPSMRRPQAISEALNPNRGKGIVSHIGHKSFAEALQGDSTMVDVKASMTVKANEDGHGWLYDSIIIRLNLDFSINSIRSALKDIGLDQVVARQGGGRDVILTFKSQEELQSNIQKIKDWFKDWSQFVLEWRPGIQIVQERCVWLKCHGISLNLWNRSNINNIGALWGTVLQLAGDLSQPKSFAHSRVQVVTTCMELINKTVHLVCKGKLYPVYVCEDLCVNPVECNGVRKMGLDDCNSSSKVEENEFIDGECKRQDDVDIAVNQFGLSDAALPFSIEVAQRKELAHCNCREAVDTVVEESRSDVEVSRPTAIGGKGAMMEECAPCPKTTAIGGKGAMMEECAPCPKSNDYSLRCVEHASATGLFKSLSGSIDAFGPGINLEVALGPTNNDHIVHGPVRMPNGTLLTVGSNGSSTRSFHVEGPVLCPASFLNPDRSAKKAGKKKVRMEGFSRFARLYGHQSAAIGRLPSKSVIFRPAAVALAHSELSEGESSMHTYLLKEAQATVQLGKDLGINFCGQEEGVVDKIMEMELKDKERFLKDGNT